MSARDVAICGTGMTDMSRRDLSPETMAEQVVREALSSSGVEPDRLGLVVFSNATGGRLCDQMCVRGQSWLQKSGLGNVPVVNVENSCAGGASAVHMGTLAVRGGAGYVLVLGVEKMWTGDRAATIEGIEDGLPLGYRTDMRARHAAQENPQGTVLMSLNDGWARECMEEHGATLEHFAAAAVKARRNGAMNPLAQVQEPVTIEEVLGAATVSGVLTRPMCSSFTDGAAALLLGPAPLASQRSPRIIATVGRSGTGEMDYHDRLADAATAAWEASGIGPEDFDVVELHDATSPEEIYALESLGLFGHGEAGPATLAGETAIGGSGVTVNPSGGLVGRGHPLGATGIAQVVEVAGQLAGRAGVRQVDGARLGLSVNTGGVIQGDAAYVGICAVAAGDA